MSSKNKGHSTIQYFGKTFFKDKMQKSTQQIKHEKNKIRDLMDTAKRGIRSAKD